MRTNLFGLTLVAAALLAPAAAVADASDSVVGRYDATFEQVTSNCAGGGLELGKATVVIARRTGGITVEVPKAATLSGTAAKGGRIRASSKAARSSVPDLDGKFSLAGTVDEGGKLEGLFVAEFFADGKPSCTQSWNVAGARAAEAKPGAPSTPSAAFVRLTGLPPME